jgi:integrase
MAKERKLPEVLNDDEIGALLALFNRRYPAAWRNQLMIKTALKTGMRISELINLKFEDLTPKGLIYTTIKGDPVKDAYLR